MLRQSFQVPLGIRFFEIMFENGTLFPFLSPMEVYCRLRDQ